MDDTLHDQIWIKLSFMPNCWIGGYYLPPSDSPYFSDSYFSSIQERCIDSDLQYIILGDFNSRIGPAIHSLSQDDGVYRITYCEDLPDTIWQPNQNGHKLLQLCRDINCAIVNNARTENSQFNGALTFRKRNLWISELDLCIVSKSCFSAVVNFSVNQDLRFPSDHAPISVTVDTDALHSHSEDLLYESASALGADGARPHMQKSKSLMSKNIHIKELDSPGP